jgi:abortive infection bacteriophage resistance protein
MRYSKPYLKPADQLALLKSRGLRVSDDERATAYLERIGYYRLSGYWYPFRAKLGTLVGDNFRPGTEFRHVVELYVFDKKLRLLMLDAIERVEIALRTSIALLLGTYDPWAHRDQQLLDGKFAKRTGASGQTPHQDWLDKLDQSFVRSNEAFAKHFRTKYPQDHAPIWIATELWDFGMLSHFYAGMRHADRLSLAKQYGVPDAGIFETWLRSINLVRNTCAHHSRLWNKPLVSQPRFAQPGVLTLLDHLAHDTNGQTRLYGAAAVIRFLLLKINPATKWPERLKSLVATLPAAPSLAISQAGFPAKWDELPLWAPASSAPGP